MPGLYGTIRPANVDPLRDVDLYYYYRPTRGTEDEFFADGFKKLDNSCLVKSSGATEGNAVGVINGLYDLRLPLNIFNQKGIYSIYIKPHEYVTTLKDVSILEGYDDPVVEGIVLDSREVDNLTDLSGYRVEYYDADGNITELTRLITTSNPCEPVKVAAGSTYSRTTRYRINNISANNLLFCTITPSTASSFKPNTNPDPGYVGQTVHIINTKFNPVLVEIEMVDHDADTISTMLEGDQIRDLDHGLITTYDENKQIYKQHEVYTLKSTSGQPLYDVKRLRGAGEVDVEGQEYDKIVED
jgi:hypothetical protein